MPRKLTACRQLPRQRLSEKKRKGMIGEREYQKCTSSLIYKHLEIILNEVYTEFLPVQFPAIPKPN